VTREKDREKNIDLSHTTTRRHRGKTARKTVRTTRRAGKKSTKKRK
jgi:hypothetical protein